MNWTNTAAGAYCLLASLVLTGCAGSALNPQVFPGPPSPSNENTGKEQPSTSCTDKAPKAGPYCQSLLAAHEGLKSERDRGDKLISGYQDAIRYQSSTPTIIASAMPFGAGYVGWRAAAHGTENSNPLLAAIALMGSAFSFNNVTYSEPRILTYLAGINALACLRENYADGTITGPDAKDLEDKLDTLQTALCRLRHQRGVALNWLGDPEKSRKTASACPSADAACKQACQKSLDDDLHSAMASMTKTIKVTDAGRKMNCDHASSSEVIKFCQSYSRASSVRKLASPGRKVLEDSVAASDELIATAEAMRDKAQRLPATIRTNTQKLSRGIHDVATAVSVQVTSTVPKPESVQQAFQSVSVVLPTSLTTTTFTQQGSKSRGRNAPYALQGPLAPAAEAVREAIAELQSSLTRVNIGDGMPKQSCNVSRPGPS